MDSTDPFLPSSETLHTGGFNVLTCEDTVFRVLRHVTALVSTACDYSPEVMVHTDYRAFIQMNGY